MVSSNQSNQKWPLLQWVLVLALLLLGTQIGSAAPQNPTVTGTPNVVSYQGQVTISGQPYNGIGYFKFAVVDAAGIATYWSNDGTAIGGNAPKTGIALNVKQGLFSVLLGDIKISGMTQPLNVDTFSDGECYLRIWFSTDNSNYSNLTPDQRIAAVPYALAAQEAVSARNADLLDGQHAADLAVPSGSMLLGAPDDNHLTSAGYQSLGLINLSPNGYPGTWSNITTTNAPEGRSGHTAVWTGSEMIIWGGNSNYASYLNSGGRYNPISNTWTATNSTNAPTGRSGHGAVWTGSEMIIWGGWNYGGETSIGGRYNPTTDTWTAINAPYPAEGRVNFETIWTGSEMIIWGGWSNIHTNYADTGWRYNPTTNTWKSISTSNAPMPRSSYSVVWTGSEMLVSGGVDSNGIAIAGARYNPSTDIWTSISTTNAPSGICEHAAVWTGTEMIVWCGRSFPYNNLASRYNPYTDTWYPISGTNAPSDRRLQSIVWTGSDLIVWGGDNSGTNPLNTGGRYSLNTDTWTTISISNAPVGRYDNTAVWTGNEMIVWGGYNGSLNTNTGGRYTTLLSLYQKP